MIGLPFGVSIMGLGLHRFIGPRSTITEKITSQTTFSSILNWRGGSGNKNTKDTISKKTKWVKKSNKLKKVDRTKSKVSEELPLVLLHLSNSSTSLPHNVIELSQSALSKYGLSDGDLICLKGKRRSSTLAVAKLSERLPPFLFCFSELDTKVVLSFSQICYQFCPFVQTKLIHLHTFSSHVFMSLSLRGSFNARLGLQAMRNLRLSEGGVVRMDKVYIHLDCFGCFTHLFLSCLIPFPACSIYYIYICSIWTGNPSMKTVHWYQQIKSL